MMLSNLDSYEIVLGSGSPRRKELFSKLMSRFSIISSDCDEVYPESLSAQEVPEYLSKLKSDDIFNALKENSLLVTADTIVIYKNEVLGKPADKDEAFEMLQKLSGQTHEVISGVTIRSSSNIRSFSDLTLVSISPISDTEIWWYIDQCQVLDKAGAYGIQDWLGLAKVSNLQGSFYNVMGLPTEKLYKYLKEWE